MRISVTAKSNSRAQRIDKIDDTHFRVSVKEPAIEGRANKAIIKALAGYFNVPPSKIRIVVGETATKKIIEIQ